MTSFDAARFSLEAATGGRNTLLLDDTGFPSVMVRIPMFLWSDVLPGGADEPCSAFVVGGKVLDCIYISKYLNIIKNGRAYSLPGRDPAHTLSIDEARAACAAKGRGWHLISNAEWAALAHWCVANGTMPHGNSNFGRCHDHWQERGVLAPGQRRGQGPEDEMRTLTGSGPAVWNHDHTAEGIADLNGNIWDFVSGLRTVDGEIQIIPDNDSAMNVDESEHSPLWRAILSDGSLVQPGTPGTLKYDGVKPGISVPDDRRLDGGFRLNTERVNAGYTGPEPDISHRAYGMMPFFDIRCADSVCAPLRLTEMALFPRQDYRDGAHFFLRNYGVRYAARGGSWYDKAGGGMWDLYIRETRAFRFPDMGFRAAYAEY